ncbi:hypothetical protein [Nostoc phage Nsp-JY18]
MSTLIVTNIRRTGETASRDARGVAASFVKFQGDGTVTINGSVNTSSITDNGVGDYAQNFSNLMADANYAVGGCASSNRNYYPGTALSILSLSTAGAPLTSAIRVTGAYTCSPSVADGRDMSVTIHGSLA